MTLKGSEAVRMMNAFKGDNSDEAVEIVWSYAIEGNIEQLREEFIITDDYADTLRLAAHRCGGDYGLDEHANDNSEMYNMINAAMRMHLMLNSIPYKD